MVIAHLRQSGLYVSDFDLRHASPGRFLRSLSGSQAPSCRAGKSPRGASQHAGSREPTTSAYGESQSIAPVDHFSRTKSLLQKHRYVSSRFQLCDPGYGRTIVPSSMRSLPRFSYGTL